jgi:hypothetical protein
MTTLAEDLVPDQLWAIIVASLEASSTWSATAGCR